MNVVLFHHLDVEPQTKAADLDSKLLIHTLIWVTSGLNGAESYFVIDESYLKYCWQLTEGEILLNDQSVLPSLDTFCWVIHPKNRLNFPGHVSVLLTHSYILLSHTWMLLIQCWIKCWVRLRSICFLRDSSDDEQRSLSEGGDGAKDDGGHKVNSELRYDFYYWSDHWFIIDRSCLLVQKCK